MRRIREEKLQDSTVTIVLVGNCTNSRRYVDWKIKAWLQQGQSIPNGLIAINLSYMRSKGNVPQRLFVLSILWGWKIDNVIPDNFDLIGGFITLVGVIVIMYAPRG